MRLIQSRKLAAGKPNVVRNDNVVRVSIRTNRLEYGRVGDTRLLFGVLLAVERPLVPKSDLLRFYTRSEYWRLDSGLRPEQATYEGNDEQQTHTITKPGTYPTYSTKTEFMELKRDDIRPDKPGESTKRTGQISEGSELGKELQSTLKEMIEKMQFQLAQRN